MFNGKKVAFIASGGGGRGVAHGGVLRACHELGFQPDMIIGASAGALTAAFYAQTGNVDSLSDLFRRGSAKKYGKSFDLINMVSPKNFLSTRLKTGLLDMAGPERYLSELLDINSFDDLPIPTYISVTNLNTGCGEVFGPGHNSHVPISKAIVASSCVPVLFRPVEIDGQYYIDGEIKRPTATILALELGADIVIVSDVYKPFTVNIEKSSMWNIVGQVGNMLLEDKSMRGIRIAEVRYPDKDIVLVAPEVGHLSVFSTQPWRRLERLGYEAALDALNRYTSND